MRPRRTQVWILFGLLLGSAAALAQSAPSACAPDPLVGRPLYLRGSFNGWTVDEAQRFRWACDRWELVTRLQGEHRFKAGDESWSADADLGRPPALAGQATSTEPISLAARGGDVVHHFKGFHRLRLRPARDGLAAQLQIEACPAAPLGNTTLYLRDSQNQWAVDDALAFTWHCDAYLLNLEAKGPRRFVVAEAAWTPGGALPAGGAEHQQVFSGAHTLRLDFDAQGQPRLIATAQSFVDPRPPRITDPVALSLRFDSRSTAHKKPFGAVPAGTRVHWAVTATPGVQSITLVLEQRELEGNQERLVYRSLLRLPMQREDRSTGQRTAAQRPDRWVIQHSPTDVAVHGYWFEARINGQTYLLHNNDQAVAWTREKGAGGAGVVGWAPAGTGTGTSTAGASTPSASVVRRFRLSVYRPDFKLPDWAPDAVVYYLFPDRFRNGDKANDPRPGTRRYQTHDVELHPRWLGTPYKPGSGDGSDAVYNNDFFGGDLAGVVDKLDHLKRLGINTIYMTPVFLAPSNHKYDHADYHRIDPAFGSNADFERLTRDAARRGIRVVPDASLNHTGSDSLYFDRYGNFAAVDGRSSGAFAFGKINPASPYADWYRFDAGQKEPDKQYQGWVGVATLPELDKQSPAWRAFAYGAADSVTRRWLQAGASGWRMDVAPWVPDDFWREWRQVVKATKPDAFTIAETWFDPSKHLLGDMFDSAMNYVFRNAVLDWANGGPATALAAQLEHLREQVPPPAHAALMNLLSSHDVARALHVLGDTGPSAGPEARALARQRYRLALWLQMSYPGAPAIYYGDEVGVTGGDDPYNRAPYPWPDEGGQPDLALEDEFRALIALRHAQPVLRRGALLAPLHADDAVLVLARHWTGGASGASRPSAKHRLGDKAGRGGQGSAPAARWAITAFNNAEQPRSVTVTLPPGAPAGPYRDALPLGAQPVQAVGAAGAVGVKTPWQLTLSLPARGARLLLAD